jgi:peptide/nickel transport system permease protein
VISLPAFAARRLLASVPLVWGVLTLVFLLTALAPGRPFESGEETAHPPEALHRLRSIYGTDRPLLDRYASWLSAFASGDFGLSYTYRRPVSDLIGEALKNTFTLAGLAIVLQFATGILAGVAAALSDGGPVDKVLSAGAMIVYSIPSYWIGLVLVWILSVKLGWLPTSQMHSIEAVPGGGSDVPDALRHLLLPCLSLALPAAVGSPSTSATRCGPRWRRVSCSPGARGGSAAPV